MYSNEYKQGWYWLSHSLDSPCGREKVFTKIDQFLLSFTKIELSAQILCGEVTPDSSIISKQMLFQHNWEDIRILENFVFKQLKCMLYSEIQTRKRMMMLCPNYCLFVSFL